ncbi:MAG: tetratricopeptide repeat protein [Bacteroidota bacterium]
MSNPQLEARILAANQQLADGEYQAALDVYTQLILAGVERADVYNNRGNARYALGDLKAAIGDYTVAIRLNPRVDYGHFNRGNCRLQLEDFEAAIRDYDRAIQFEPRHAVAFFRKGKALFQLGQPEAALESYQAGLAVAEEVEGWAGLAEAQEAMGQIEKALESWQKIEKLHPQTPDLHRNMAELLWRLGQAKEALQQIRKAIQQDTADETAPGLLAMWLEELGEYPASLEAYEQWLERGEDQAAPWYGKGRVLWANGQKEAAVAAWEKVLTIEADHVPALYQLGAWAFEQQDYALTIDYMSRLLEKERDHAQAYLLRGKARRRSGENFPALTDFEMALSKDGALWESLEWRGEIFLEIKRFEEAIRAFTSVLKQQADHINSLNGRGRAYGALEKWPQASQDFERVVSLAPNFLGGRFNLVKTLLEIGDAEKALPSAQWLTEHFPKDPRASLTAAQVFWQVRDVAKAMQWGQVAQQHGHPEAPAFLTLLERIQAQSNKS